LAISSKSAVGVAIIVSLCIFPCLCVSTQAQTVIPFQPSDQFEIPSSNGDINFAVNGSYSFATFENNTWTFLNLHLNGSQTITKFMVSAQNSNITIFSYRANNNTSFQSIRLRYAAHGQGEQIFNFGVSSEQDGLDPSLTWNVVVNGNVFLAKGDGWTISKDGTLVVNGATGNVSVVHYRFNSFGNTQNSNLPFDQQHSIGIWTIAVLAIIVGAAVAIKVRETNSLKKSDLLRDFRVKELQASTKRKEGMQK